MRIFVWANGSVSCSKMPHDLYANASPTFVESLRSNGCTCISPLPELVNIIAKQREKERNEMTISDRSQLFPRFFCTYSICSSRQYTAYNKSSFEI